ncbi:MAG: ACT domain-containing protein [Oscillospiraceae bacterium]
MKAIVTVIGKDQTGIIAGVCAILSAHGVNVMDISQTILQDYFTMMMLVEVSNLDMPFADFAKTLETDGETRGLSIRVQREDIFNAMHKI